MLKRLFALVLVISMMTAPTLFSCGKTASPVDSKETTAQSAESQTTTKQNLIDLIPKNNYNEYDFRILSMNTEAYWWALTMETAEAQTGEPVNDAFYIRNTRIEDLLKIKITDVSGVKTDSGGRINKAIKSGTDEFDIAIASSYTIGPLATNKMFYNLLEIPALQLKQPWWDQQSIKNFSIINQLYFMTGDYHLMNNDATWMVYFNKIMMKDLNLEMPYKIVADGKWTFDKMMEYMKAAVIDVDGDGEFTASDKWGMVTHSQHYSGLLIAAGEDMVKKDETDIPSYTKMSDKFANVYAKILEMMHTTGYTMDINTSVKGLPSDKHATKNFLNGDALFCSEVLSHTRVFREMENDFGIIPLPKLDEIQQSYHSLVLDHVGVTVIPITNSNTEQTAVILDALGAMSMETIIPAYYDISLIGKFFRDDESREMLDIIRGSRCYSLAGAYAWSGVLSAFEQAGVKNNTAIASFLEKNEPKVNTAIEKTLNNFS